MKNNLPLKLRVQPRCPKLKMGQIWTVFDNQERKNGVALLVLVIHVLEDSVVVSKLYANKKRRISVKDIILPENSFYVLTEISKLYIKSKSLTPISRNIFKKKEGAYCIGYLRKGFINLLEL